jgi:hypothetical protein
MSKAARPVRTDLHGRNPEALAWELARWRAMSIEERAKILFDLIEAGRIMRAATTELRPE